MNKTIQSIINNHLCSGCGTCSVVCNKMAITFHYNNMGQLLPVIDMNRCIDCGMCYNICPSLDKKGIVSKLIGSCDSFVGTIKTIYIGKSSNESIFKNSQSGGATTAILAFLFDQQRIDAAIVCRTGFDIGTKAESVIIHNKEELFACQKSSYIPLNMVSALNETQQYESVVFVGTGCHIQGVRTLMATNKRFSNIKYLLGLICDRTLCKTAVDVLARKCFAKQPINIIWRDKEQHYKKAKLFVVNKNGGKKEIPSWKRHALKPFFTSPRCRICFDKLNVGADIVLGDPWGMKDVDWERGESLVLTRTDKGTSLIDEMIITGDLLLRNSDVKDALRGQNIDGKRNSVRQALSVYSQSGWTVPMYAEKIGFSDSNNETKKDIQHFIDDLTIDRKHIIRKYSRYLKILSFKKNMYKIIHFTTHR